MEALRVRESYLRGALGRLGTNTLPHLLPTKKPCAHGAALHRRAGQWAYSLLSAVRALPARAGFSRRIPRLLKVEGACVCIIEYALCLLHLALN
jgi:hypothetical protein